MLTPVVISGGGRTGSTAIMELLGSDPHVGFDREYPFENRYLLYLAKFARLLQRPDLMRFINHDQAYDLDTIGCAGAPPLLLEPFPSAPGVYLPGASPDHWIREMWAFFSRQVTSGRPHCRFYAEKAPNWLSPMLRQFMPCYTIYNVRDPRDIFISANQFMKRRNYLSFSRQPGDSDVDHARRLALVFANTFENYYMDRERRDCMLLRYEDLVLQAQKVVKEIRGWCGIEASTSSDPRFFPHHRTAKDLQHTIARWRSDPIPPEVAMFLERALRSEMSELGYEVTQSRQDFNCPTVSFVRGADPVRIPSSSDGYLEQAADYAVVKVHGIDFWIILPFEPFDAEPVKEVWVSARGDIGELFSLYWHGPHGDFSEERTMTVRYTPSAHWSVLSFPVNTHPQWRGAIHELRLDLFNANRPPHEGSGQVRWVRLVG